MFVELRFATSVNLAFFFESHAIVCFIGAVCFFYFIDDKYEKPSSRSARNFK